MFRNVHLLTVLEGNMRLSDPITTEYILLPEKVRYVMQHLELLNPVSRLIISTW